MALEPLSNPKCQVCKSTDNLQKCSGCKVIYYCSKEHQNSDWYAHKRCCKAIQKSQNLMDAEEARLHNLPPGTFTPANPFEDSVGHFWGIWETRPYMRLRYSLVEVLLKVDTVDAVQSALAHMMDMFRLCRSDNMGVRSQVPSVMLRLHKDQECYDFVKWWTTCDPDGTYDWGDMDLPYLNMHGEDVFEPCDVFLESYPDIGHTVALTLLKIRLLIDLQAAQSVQPVIETTNADVPPEIAYLIRERAVGDIFVRRRDVLGAADLTPHIKNMHDQILQLYKHVEKSNGHMWPALLDPKGHLNARPESYSGGSPEEMQLVLQYSYTAWVETPGAIEILRTISRA